MRLIQSCVAAERRALIDPVNSSIRKTTWNFNRSPVARHSDANTAAAAAAASAFSSSVAAQAPVMNGSRAAAAVVTPAIEARFKLEQVMSAQLLWNITTNNDNLMIC